MATQQKTTATKTATKPAATATKPTTSPLPAYLVRGGSEGLKKAEALKTQREKEASNRQPYRTWVDVNVSKTLIYLDTDGVSLREHNYLDKDGKPNIFKTCTSEFAECPHCEEGNKSYWLTARTVIDPTPFTTKKGETRSYTKKLHIVKYQAMPRYLDFIQNQCGGDLRLKAIELKRFSDKEAKSGLPSRVVAQLTEAQLAAKCPKDMKLEEYLAPFDYAAIFAPESAEDARKSAGQATPIGSEDGLDGLNGLGSTVDTPPAGTPQELDDLFSWVIFFLFSGLSLLGGC